MRTACWCGAAAVLWLAVAAFAAADKAQEAAIQQQAAKLKDPDAQVRLKAAQALGDMGPAAKSAAPALRKCLRDKDEQVRAAAKSAIDAIDPPPGAATVALLVKELQSPDKQARHAAAEALGSLGGLAETALGPLRAATKDPEPAVRIAAMKAVALIEADRREGKHAAPLRPADIAGTYIGEPVTDEAIAQASWKKGVPGAIPGLINFQPQPAGLAREKVRTIFSGSIWTLTDAGDLTVQLTIPRGWEPMFGAKGALRINGSVKAEKDVLKFALQHRGGGVTTQVWLTGEIRCDERGRVVAESQLTATGQEILEATVRQTLEAK